MRYLKRILQLIGEIFYLFGRPLQPIGAILGLLLMEIRMGYLRSFFLKSGGSVRILSPYRIIGHKFISIGEGFSSLYGLRIEAFDSYLNQRFSPAVIIGRNVCFNTDCHIGCINKVIIGDNVLVASRVFITDHSHGESDTISEHAPSNRSLVSKGPVIIGNNVWIGEGVVILPNVNIGDNCIIGANAVVTKDIEPNSVVGGIPARLIKTLN